MTTLRRARPYPSAAVYRAVLMLRRHGRRVENYDRDRRLHVLDNAIVDEAGLIERATGLRAAGTARLSVGVEAAT